MTTLFTERGGTTNGYPIVCGHRVKPIALNDQGQAHWRGLTRVLRSSIAATGCIPTALLQDDPLSSVLEKLSCTKLVLCSTAAWISSGFRGAAQLHQPAHQHLSCWSLRGSEQESTAVTCFLSTAVHSLIDFGAVHLRLTSYPQPSCRMFPYLLFWNNSAAPCLPHAAQLHLLWRCG